MYLRVVLAPVFLIHQIFSNLTLPSGYHCVLAGTCPPGQTLPNTQKDPCLDERTACRINITVSYKSKCGLRTVTNVSTTDGPATQGAYPWQVFLRNETGYCGSGALIRANAVVTAAHKVSRYRLRPVRIGVYMGVYNSDEFGTRFTVTIIHIHPGFNESYLLNAIAILILKESVTNLPQPLVNTICEPTAVRSFIGLRCFMSGWGQTNFHTHDAPQKQQRQVTIVVVNYDTCLTSMSRPDLLGPYATLYLDKHSVICAGGEPNIDACTGDGGSPLVYNHNQIFELVGLVLWGKGCGQPGVYGVYLNTIYYYNWIQGIVGPA